MGVLGWLLVVAEGLVVIGVFSLVRLKLLIFLADRGQDVGRLRWAGVLESYGLGGGCLHSQSLALKGWGKVNGVCHGRRRIQRTVGRWLLVGSPDLPHDSWTPR